MIFNFILKHHHSTVVVCACVLVAISFCVYILWLSQDNCNKKNKRALFIIKSSLICNKISIPSTIAESNGHGIRFERTVNIVVYKRRWFDKFHLILAPNVNGTHSAIKREI